MSNVDWVALVGSIFGSGGLFAWWTARRAARTAANKEAAEAAAEAAAAEQKHLKAFEDTLWSRMQERLDQQDAKIEYLTQQLKLSNDREYVLQSENRKLEIRARDAEELVDDFMDYHLSHAEWESGGSVPPNPVLSWRASKAIIKRQKEREGEE